MDELLKANVGYQGLETRRLDERKVEIVIVLWMLEVVVLKYRKCLPSHVVIQQRHQVLMHTTTI